MSNAARPPAFQRAVFAQSDRKKPQVTAARVLRWDHVPVHPDDSAAEAQPRRRRFGIWTVVIVLVWAALPLYHFGFGAYDLYNYARGTPTTATVSTCPVHRTPGTRNGGVLRMLQPRECDGTWTVGGQQYSGPIQGRRAGYAYGESLGVRVVNGTAFTAAGVSWRFIAGAITTALVSVFALLIWWIKRIRSSRSPILPTET